MTEEDRQFRLSTVTELQEALDNAKKELDRAFSLATELVTQGEAYDDLTKKEAYLFKQTEGAMKSYKVALRNIKQHLGRVRTRLENADVTS